MINFVSQLLWQYRRLLHGICKYAGERIVAHGPLVFFLACWKTMVFSITHLSLYSSPLSVPNTINKMPNFCAMAKECNIFSFELHSNMLNLHWKGHVWYAIPPRTGDLQACLSSKRQIWPPLHREKNDFLFHMRLKDYNSGLIIWESQ